MSNTATEGYLRLVQALVSQNQLPPEQLAMIAASLTPVDPCEFARFTKGFSPAKIHAYAKAYTSLAHEHIDWPSVQERLAAMATESLFQRDSREQAKIETEPLVSLRTVGGIWCGLFEHDGWFSHWRVPDLAFAYRGPSLFLSAMRKAGAHVAFLFADEQITDACFGPPGGEIHQALLTYVCTHGECPASGYQAYLHHGIWEPGKTRFGSACPIVMVFDTCNLIGASAAWQWTWADTLRGGSVRLLLGFEGLASIDSASSLRGVTFAENLRPPKHMSYADAWIDAVRSRAVTDDCHAIAIGVGECAADAEAMLHLTLEDTSRFPMPPRLRPGPVYFAVKDLYATNVSNTPY